MTVKNVTPKTQKERAIPGQPGYVERPASNLYRHTHTDPQTPHTHTEGGGEHARIFLQ